MNDLERQIINMVHDNPNLSEDLKKRYILALFLMSSDEQKEYLKLIQAFTYRCGAIERGIYIVPENEKHTVLRTLAEAKEDILKKIHSNNQ